jgi:exodeoxyribonuclease VII small subunit
MSDSPSENPTFEQALADLEKIVRELEDGRPGLEESLASYEKGVSLLKYCYGQLQGAEQRVLQLTGVDAEGRPLLQPFEHQAAHPNAPDDWQDKERLRTPRHSI